MSVATEPSSPPAPPAPRSRRPVNARSLLLGLLGTLFICVLTPFNDFVVGNTYLVGNFLPIGLLLFFIVVVVAVNAPLHRWAPRTAFTAGELGVALSMTLVSCALPSSGLMRYLPGQLAGVYYQSAQNAEYRKVLEQANLPDWLFPTFDAASIEERAAEPVITDFYLRADAADGSLLARARAVPWDRWATPALAWGAFSALLFLAVLCGSVIVRRQWAENERLPFPLADVYASLIEAPAPGKAFNALLSTRSFWVVAWTIFAIHGINALHVYAPRFWPQIPLGFDLNTLMTGALAHTDWQFKASTIYFCVVGVTFFLQTQIAFSLWFCFILYNVASMILGSYQATISGGMKDDQIYGALLCFAAFTLWIGRQQWLLIARQMLRGPRPGEAQGRYLPYRFAGWGFVAALAGMIGWLMAAGATLTAAAVLVGGIMTLLLVMARIVAETGLVFAQVTVPPFHPWLLLAHAFDGAAAVRTTHTSMLLSTLTSTVYVRDLREALPVYTTNALRVGDTTAFGSVTRWTGAIAFTGALALALLIGWVAAGSSMLFMQYSYATTLDRNPRPINEYGTTNSPKHWTLDPPRDYRPPGVGGQQAHDRATHVGVGAVITGALGWLRLRFMHWPLHPVGFLLCYSFPMGRIWFSILLGWLAKLIIVRFGGASLYRHARPVFIGMILGEVAAAAFWLIVSLVLLSQGMDYRAINLLPT